MTALLHLLQVEQRLRLIACEAPVALCYGLLRPRLLLSTGLLERVSSAELEAVLHHEHTHLRRRDPLRLVLVRVLAEALPGFSAVRALAAAVPLAQELAADRVALAAVRAEALATALLKVGDALGPLRGQVVAVGAFSTLDVRIDQLLGDPVMPMPSTARVVMPVLAAFLVSPWFCLFGLLIWYVLMGPSVVKSWGWSQRSSHRKWSL